MMNLHRIHAHSPRAAPCKSFVTHDVRVKYDLIFAIRFSFSQIFIPKNASAAITSAAIRTAHFVDFFISDSFNLYERLSTGVQTLAVAINHEASEYASDYGMFGQHQGDACRNGCDECRHCVFHFVFLSTHYCPVSSRQLSYTSFLPSTFFF